MVTCMIRDLFIAYFIRSFIHPITCQQTMEAGTCVDFVCRACLPNASMINGNACIACSPTATSGLDITTGDCTCPANTALVDTDAVGNALTYKTCDSCPTGEFVVTDPNNKVFGR